MIVIICLIIGATIGLGTMCLMNVAKDSERRITEMRVKLDGGIMPTRAHETDAGLDLYSPIEVTIDAHSSAFIPTGVCVELPINTAGMVKSKSGLNLKGLQSEGVIDVGYTGGIGVKLYNHSSNPYTVKRGDKISQLVIVPILTPKLKEVKELDATERGNGGFGSTGR